jgi:hypothetical protein
MILALLLTFQSNLFDYFPQMALEWTCTYAQDLFELYVKSSSWPHLNSQDLRLNIARGPVNWTGDLFLKTLRNTVTLHVDSNYTIYQINEMFQVREGVPIEAVSSDLFYLTFAGKRLEDDKTLNEYAKFVGPVLSARHVGLW